MNVSTRGRDILSVSALMERADHLRVPGRWYGNACERLGLAEGDESWQLPLLQIMGVHDIVNEGTDAAAIAHAIEASGEAPSREMGQDWLIAAFAFPASHELPARVHCVVVLSEIGDTAGALSRRPLSSRY